MDADPTGDLSRGRMSGPLSGPEARPFTPHLSWDIARRTGPREAGVPCVQRGRGSGLPHTLMPPTPRPPGGPNPGTGCRQGVTSREARPSSSRRSDSSPNRRPSRSSASARRRRRQDACRVLVDRLGVGAVGQVHVVPADGVVGEHVAGPNPSLSIHVTARSKYRFPGGLASGLRHSEGPSRPGVGPSLCHCRTQVRARTTRDPSRCPSPG